MLVSRLRLKFFSQLKSVGNANAGGTSFWYLIRAPLLTCPVTTSDSFGCPYCYPPHQHLGGKDI